MVSVPATTRGPEYSRLDVLVDHFGLTLIGGMFPRLEIPTVSRRQGSGKT